MLTRMTKTKRKFYRRKWLNSAEGTAYIVVRANVEQHVNKKTGTEEQWVYAYAEFKDCNRQCSLEFDFDNERQKKQRITKLGLIIKELNELKAYLEGVEVYGKRKIKKEPVPVDEVVVDLKNTDLVTSVEPRVIEMSAICVPFLGGQGE